jgi:hypothetical protein
LLPGVSGETLLNIPVLQAQHTTRSGFVVEEEQCRFNPEFDESLAGAPLEPWSNILGLTVAQSGMPDLAFL